MLATAVMPQPALKYEVEVHKPGRIELDGPFAAGSRLLIFVIQDLKVNDAVNGITIPRKN